MTGKTALITGIDSRVGYLAGLDLATRGARVFVTTDDAAWGARAARELRRAAGHDEVHFLDGGASASENRRLGAAVAERTARLDVLINAAPDEVEPEDALARHLLAPFALTEAVRPLLARTPEARVVNHVSSAYALVKYDPFAMAEPNAHARAMMLALLWTFALARRASGDGVTVNAVDPNVPSMTAFLASADPVRGVTGTYFDAHHSANATFVLPNHPTMRTLDVEDQERAWELARQRTADAGDIPSVRRALELPRRAWRAPLRAAT